MQAIRQDMRSEDYGRLYFLLSLCLIEAYDENDYDRHEAIKKALHGMRMHDLSELAEGIAELEEL